MLLHLSFVACAFLLVVPKLALAGADQCPHEPGSKKTGAGGVCPNKKHKE
jgi:hypothetical protein